MYKAAVLFIFLSGMAATGFAQSVGTPEAPLKSKAHFDKLVAGMSEMEVRDNVGFPMRVEPFVTVKRGTTDTLSYWVYDNLYTLVFSNHRYVHLEKDRAGFLLAIRMWADPNNKDNVQYIYGNKR